MEKGIGQKAAEQIVSTSFNLGMYTGTQSTAAEMANQSQEIERGERDSFDEFKIAKAGVVGHLEGNLMGAVGGVGSAFAYKRAAVQDKLRKAAGDGKAIPQTLKMGKLLISEPAEVLAEGAVFTGTNVYYEGLPQDEQGNIDWKDLTSQFLINSAFVGGMKVITDKIFKGKSKEIIEEAEENSVSQQKI